MRILQNSAATVTAQLLGADGDISAPPPTTATVTVTRDDGTAIATAASTLALGGGVFSFPLTTANTALLDHLTLDWVDTASGATTRTYVDVVGGFLFTLPEARAVSPTATNDQLLEVRTRVEQAIEDACGLAFVPRYDRATLNGDGTTLLRLGRPFLRRVRWASTVVAGVTTALLPADLSALSISPAGFVAGYRWLSGYGTAVVGFEHGMDRPPEPVRAAALDYARFLLTQDSSIDSRAERLITDDGTLVFGGGMTGLPSVDRVLEVYRLPAVA